MSRARRDSQFAVMGKHALFTALTIGFLCNAPSATAQIFKCVSVDGSVAFSQTPCPDPSGNSSYIGESVRTPVDGPAESSAEIVRRNLQAADIMSNGDRKRQLAAEKAERESAAAAAALAAQQEKPQRVRTSCSSFGATELCRSSDGSKWKTQHNGNYSHTRGVDANGEEFRSNSSKVGGTTFTNTTYDD